MNDIETRHNRILLNEFHDKEVRQDMEHAEIEAKVQDAMRPGGSHDPFGSYDRAVTVSQPYLASWLSEALGQMTFDQEMELSALLRGGYDTDACNLIREVAKKYAERCARSEFGGE